MILLLLALLAPVDTAYRSWTLGSRVHAAFNQVYIRADSTATGRVLDSVNVGAKGTLIGGPWLAADGGQRWQVRYDPPKPTGWTRQMNLLMDTLNVPPPPPPVVVSKLYLFPEPPLTLSLWDNRSMIGIVDSSGVPVRRGVIWTSSDTMIAAFHTNTLFAQRPGTVTITGTAGTVVATGTATVVGVQIQVPAFGQLLWTGQYDWYEQDAAGNRVAHIHAWVLPP